MTTPIPTRRTIPGTDGATVERPNYGGSMDRIIREADGTHLGHVLIRDARGIRPRCWTSNSNVEDVLGRSLPEVVKTLRARRRG